LAAGRESCSSFGDNASRGSNLRTRRGSREKRRLAIVLATLLGSFSVLWVINFKVVAIDQILTLLR